MEGTSIDLRPQIYFIYYHPSVWKKFIRFCNKLSDEMHEKYQRELRIKEAKNKRRMTKSRKCHERMWARESALRKKKEKERQLRKAQFEKDNVDKYHKMEFSTVLKDYLDVCFISRICGKGSMDCFKLLKIIEREVAEFRSQTEQEEFKKKVHELKESGSAPVSENH
jgi:hypothetical protein